MRVRVATLAGNGIHRFHVFGAEVVQHFARQPHRLVLAHPRLHGAVQLVISGVNHHGRRIEQRNLILRLDDARIRHELLAVHYRDSFSLQCKEDRRLDNVDSQRFLVQPALLELNFYFSSDVFRAAHLRRHGAAKQGDSRA